MSDLNTEKRGSLLFIDFDTLFQKFARYNDLANYSIIVASHELSGSLKLKSAETTRVSTGVRYESKYDNIEFVDSIRPSAQVMERMFNGDPKRVADAYSGQLISVEPFSDLCAIVDMIVNAGCDVMILMASYECAGHAHEMLRDFILDNFWLRGYTFSELERLSNYYGEDAYDKIVATLDYKIPDEFDGSDFRCILRNYGNREEIVERLETQKLIAADMMKTPGEDDDLKTMFFNRFTEDLEHKVRDVLMERSERAIKDMCRERGIRITSTATKDTLVNRIIHEMKIDSHRVVEYQE